MPFEKVKHYFKGYSTFADSLPYLFLPVTFLLSHTQEITRETNGEDQVGNVIGKPKVGDTVRLKYRAYTMKKGRDGKLKKDGNFIDTDHLGPQVAFQVTEDKEHTGLYEGLNAVVKSMNLGEEANVILSSDLAFGEQGLSRFYEPNAGYLKSRMGILGTVMPSNPNAPSDHHNRNPLCIAYVGVQPGSSIFLEGLALMEVNNKRRAIPTYSCCDCIVSSIMNGFGLNSGTY